MNQDIKEFCKSEISPLYSSPITIQIYKGNVIQYIFIKTTQRYNKTRLLLINGKC